jgi:hypothetical protein
MLSIAILLAACGQEPAATQAPGAAANAADGLAVDAKIGVALFPGSRVVSSSSTTGGAAAAGVFRLEAAAAPGEVAAFYRDAAEAAGWTVRTNVNAGAMRMIGATKGDENLTVQVTNRAGGPGSTAIVVRGARTAG